MDKNISMHISDRGHMNITLNIYHCGNMDVTEPLKKQVDYYLLYYVHEGDGTVEANNICHRISKGNVFVVFPNKNFIIKPEYGKALNITWVAFSGHLVDRYLERSGITINSPVSNDNSENELEEMFIKAVASARVLPNRYCKISACLYNIFAFLLDNCSRVNEPTSYSHEYYLIKALDFIDIYYNDRISIEQISDYLGVTRKYLYNIFKKLTDISPKDYIIYYRIDKAALLLLNSTVTIESIATSVGYSNQFHFAKEFKKIVGKTPTEYRNSVRKDSSQIYVSPINEINRNNISTQME